MSFTETLHNAQQGHKVFDAFWREAKALLVAGHKLQLTLKRQGRSLPQNSHIHPLVTRIAKLSGRPTDTESLQRLRYLLLEAWRHETGRNPVFERSLDGMRWVSVNAGTSDLDKPDCSEFIEWLLAFEAQHA